MNLPDATVSKTTTTTITTSITLSPVQLAFLIRGSYGLGENHTFEDLTDATGEHIDEITVTYINTTMKVTI